MRDEVRHPDPVADEAHRGQDVLEAVRPEHPGREGAARLGLADEPAALLNTCRGNSAGPPGGYVQAPWLITPVPAWAAMHSLL